MSMGGKKVDQNQLSGFVKGKTTYDEVIRQRGKPTQSMDSTQMELEH